LLFAAFEGLFSRTAWLDATNSQMTNCHDRAKTLRIPKRILQDDEDEERQKKPKVSE